jgi:tetratricopeptide (TPR) repeat protein
MKTYKSFVIFILLIIVGCAVQQPVMKEEKTAKFKIPPGVDTLTAVIADSIFSLVLVTEEDEQESRRLFEIAEQWSSLADSLWRASISGLENGQDSLVAMQQISRTEELFRSDKVWLKQTRKIMKKLGRLNPAVLSHFSNHLSVQANSFYENAIRKNRFELRYRQKYSQFLKDLSVNYKDQSSLYRAADELERVVFIIKGNQQLYYELGEIYFMLGDWKSAHKNFEFAHNALRKTAIFAVADPKSYFIDISKVPVDTVRLVYFLDKQATCKTRSYEALPALSLYREGVGITPDPAWKDYFESRITWILWDDGNIRASEIRDRADSLSRDYKKYSESKAVYLELLPILWTKRTKDEINWKIAQLDFTYLDQKFDGVGRMYQVIKHTAMDSISGAPIDSTYKRYFNSYGAMCFSMGTDYYDKDRLIAYMYLIQAAETNFDQRARAFLQLAGISQFDPHETISLCMKTMEVVDDLSVDETQILYQLLHTSYRKLGDFDKAKEWFDRWNAL